MIMVCHVTDNIRPAVGITQVILELMMMEGVRATCLLIGNGGIDSRFPPDAVHRIAISRGFASGIIRIIRATRELRRLHSEGYNIVHSHTRRADSICVVAKLIGYKIVRTQHVTYHTDATLLHRTLRVARAFFTGHSWQIDKWIGVSATASAYIQSRWRIPASKVETIFNGVDTEAFSPPDRELKAFLRSKFHFSSEWFVCLAVGTLTRGKRYTELLEMFSVLCKRRPNARLVIAGEGSLAATLELQASELRIDDKIIFLGRRNDIGDIMKASDLFVHSATDEALGIVLIEAMSSGLPVVAVKSQGPAEVVIENVSGVLVDSLMPREYALKVIALVDSEVKRARLGSNARASAIERFSLSTMQRNYIRVYRTLQGQLLAH